MKVSRELTEKAIVTLNQDDLLGALNDILEAQGIELDAEVGVRFGVNGKDLQNGFQLQLEVVRHEVTPSEDRKEVLNG